MGGLKMDGRKLKPEEIAAFEAHLRHGHPSVRGAVYHGGGGPVPAGGHFPQREGSHHPAAGEALSEAAEIRPSAKK